MDRQGDSVQTLIKWDDAAKTLSLEPASKQTASRAFKVELIPDGVSKEIQYSLAFAVPYALNAF